MAPLSRRRRGRERGRLIAGGSSAASRPGKGGGLSFPPTSISPFLLRKTGGADRARELGGRVFKKGGAPSPPDSGAAQGLSGAQGSCTESRLRRSLGERRGGAYRNWGELLLGFKRGAGRLWARAERLPVAAQVSRGSAGRGGSAPPSQRGAEPGAGGGGCRGAASGLGRAALILSSSTGRQGGR